MVQCIIFSVVFNIFFGKNNFTSNDESNFILVKKSGISNQSLLMNILTSFFPKINLN